MAATAPGQIVILNGAPRSGKSSIVRVIQETFAGPWMNLGVDAFFAATPERYRPAIGLRPGPGGDRGAGGDRPDLEPLVPVFYAALYESVAAYSRLGLNVAVDVGHHEAIHKGMLSDCARRLAGLPVLFVGVRCPIEAIMERRRAAAGERRYIVGTAEEPVPPPVALWQEEVHKPGVYDLEVDTSRLSPEQCAEAIRARLRDGPPGTAFAQLASG